MNTSTNYYDFLIDLWAITKNEKGFKAFAPIIKFHKVNKAISNYLLSNEWIIKDIKTKLYIWNKNKPTKKDAILIHDIIKQSDVLKKQQSKVKKSKAPKNAKHIVHAEKNIIHESDNTNELVKSLAELGQTMDAAFKPRKGMAERYGCGIITTEVNKSEVTPMPEAVTYKSVNELNDDVKEVLKETVLEIKKGQRVTDLEELVAELQLKLSTQELEYQIQLDTERALQQDAIDKLVYETGELNLQLVAASRENDTSKTYITFLHGENKKLQEYIKTLDYQIDQDFKKDEEIKALTVNFETTKNHLSSQEIYSASLLNTIAELKDTNTKLTKNIDDTLVANALLTKELNDIKQTNAYKVSKWFRK